MKKTDSDIRNAYAKAYDSDLQQEEKEEDFDSHKEYAKTYIDILKTYNEQQIKETIKTRNNLKRKFFNLIRILMIFLILLFCFSIVASICIFYLMVDTGNDSFPVVTGAITAVISSLSTMILSISKLPKLIAKYLFNENEDRSMTEIIKNIQSYELKSAQMNTLGKNDAQKKINDQKADDDEDMKISPVPSQSDVS